MQHQIIQQQFDEERALYALRDTEVIGCTFAGPADGESPLKEGEELRVHNCKFSLRYPLWHTKNFLLSDSHLDETARAPLWYTELGTLRRCRVDGVKALRECEDTLVESSVIRSPEFAWKCHGLRIRNSSLTSEYAFFESREGEIRNLSLSGKYSFQYVENMTVENSVLETKDAFWHAKNVTVTDSVLRGEYLGWFSEGLTLVNCHIAGTQPLCYCKGLRLIDCTMEGCDLSFEYSEVEAEVKGHILSVKNPKSGCIRADSIGEILREGSVMESLCDIQTANELLETSSRQSNI